jgi:hypothetical protein
MKSLYTFRVRVGDNVHVRCESRQRQQSGNGSPCRAENGRFRRVEKMLPLVIFVCVNNQNWRSASPEGRTSFLKVGTDWKSLLKITT